MAHSDDLRKRVVEAVFRGGMSRNAAAGRFEVSIASAVRWAHRFSSTGAMSPAPTGGDRRSDRIEAHSVEIGNLDLGTDRIEGARGRLQHCAVKRAVFGMGENDEHFEHGRLQCPMGPLDRRRVRSGH